MKKLVIVSAVSEVKQDNGPKQEKRNYKTIEFSTPSKVAHTDEATGEKIIVSVQPRKTSINLYEKAYLDNKMQFGYDLQVGERTFGDIVTRKVKPYEIPVLDTNGKETGANRTVDTYTTVVLGDSEAGNWESIIKAAFKAKGHDLADSTPMNFSIASNEETGKEAFASKETEKASA